MAIEILFDHPALRFAASECNRLWTATVMEGEMALRLGLFEDFTQTAELTDEMGLSQPDLDDAWAMAVRGGKGYIAGSNPRSVVQAVYRLFEEAGCRWLRPGRLGEWLPKLDAQKVSFAHREKASYRHRGICIEGAVSLENVVDMIDWAPRLGFNGYFFQFREYRTAHTFFQRWYGHTHNSYLDAEEVTVEQARGYVQAAADELEKRGMVHHAVGHGWTCEPFGIPGLGWEPKQYDLPPETTQYLAEVNGQREIWQGIPLNTSLCYGNPEVRQKMAEDIAQYAADHTEIDVLHVWLADGSNNQCECPLCRDTRPADFYIQILNMADELMTRWDVKARIVFLAYFDLLWPPQQQKLFNPERFILMFAPITRSYSHAFETDQQAGELPKFDRNKLTFPKTAKDNVAFLREWQKQTNTDSFDFDYHLMWDTYLDPGFYQNAQVLYKDIQNLHALGLNGLISCQVQRVFMPTALPMVTMGRMLWNRDLFFENIAAEYFDAAFGIEGEKVRAYLSEVSHRFHPNYLRGEMAAVVTRALVTQYAALPEFLHAFRPTTQRNMTLYRESDPVRYESWRILELHRRMLLLLAQALFHKSAGDGELAASAAHGLYDFMARHEMDMQGVYDVFEAVSVYGERLL